MFNFLNNYNKFLFASTGRDTSSVDSNEDLNARLDELNGDEENLDTSSVQKSKSKKSALKTAGENLVQNTKQLGSLAKENITGIAFASAGTALTGFGVYKIIDEISKTRASVFSDKAHKFHEFYNANKEILGIPGVDSFLSGTNKELILNFLNLKDQSLINTLLGNQSLFTNNNALSLFQNDSFLNLVNPANSTSLNLLFNNISLFTNENIDLINTIMGDEVLQNLFNSPLAPELINSYILSNNPDLLQVFGPEMQNLLTNPQMLEMVKNPEFFKLFLDPNIAPFLTNPDFQALLMGNPDLIKTLLSNPDILKFLNTQEALQMLQNPQLATLLQNQVSSDAFFEMFKNPEALQNVLNSNDLTNYLEASANVGISPLVISGIILATLTGIILTGIGIKMFTDIKEKQKVETLVEIKTDREQSKTDKEKSKITKLFDDIMNSISKLFTKVIGLFKKKEITSKEVGEVSNEIGNINNNITKLNNLIPENQTLTIGGSAVVNLHTSKYIGYYPVEEKLSIEKNDGIEKIKEKINEFIIDNIIKINENQEIYKNIISNIVDKVFSESQNENMNKDQATELFNNIINQSLQEITLNYSNETNVPQRFEITSTEFVEKQKEQGPELK